MSHPFFEISVAPVNSIHRVYFTDVDMTDIRENFFIPKGTHIGVMDKGLLITLHKENPKLKGSHRKAALTFAGIAIKIKELLTEEQLLEYGTNMFFQLGYPHIYDRAMNKVSGLNDYHAYAIRLWEDIRKFKKLENISRDQEGFFREMAHRYAFKCSDEFPVLALKGFRLLHELFNGLIAHINMEIDLLEKFGIFHNKQYNKMSFLTNVKLLYKPIFNDVFSNLEYEYAPLPKLHERLLYNRQFLDNTETI
jgi:hypothetical protein